MSFKIEHRNRIKQYILEKIEDQQPSIVERTANAFNISKNTVYRYIHELESQDIIHKEGRTFSLVEKTDSFFLQRSKNELSAEDIIYNQYIKKYIVYLPENIQKIWQYSFMEMMNNAIDHSDSEYVSITIIQNYLNTTILIADDGVGIFKKIKEYYHYETLDDAVNELFKGKLTTDSAHHSGEGIFFTSRVLDRFAALSGGKIFTHDKYSEILRNLKDTSLNNLTNIRGTVILMSLSNFSKREISEVFDMFSDVDGGFTKTHIPIKNIYDTYPVSRSQAKRLCHRFEKFEEVELDFNGVDDIGQGFAHEIFVVFQNSHPDIKIISTHTNPSIDKMISHVKQTNI